MEKIEIKEMPNKELLERFMSQIVLGQAVGVYFDSEKGAFIDHGIRPINPDTKP